VLGQFAAHGECGARQENGGFVIRGAVGHGLRGFS
jgi:hypothetical protein